MSKPETTSGRSGRRLLLLAVLALVLVGFFGLGLDDYLSLDRLKASRARFDAWHAAHPLLVSAGFFLFYVGVTALSLPGAAIMTLAAGALFGLVQGLLLVSFASSLGALLAFWVARFLLRDLVQARFGRRLQAINRGIERDGAFYLFTLRLVPVFPFFVINLVMGLTRLRSWTFYWVSQVGMLAGTAVYVNAGTQLAEVERIGDIVSPGLLASFAVLGVFPWLARGILRLINRRRVYRGWRRPRSYDRNLIVIGAGAGGLVAAYIAATVRARVTLIEAHKMGGDCLNYGCVPSKALIRSARVAAEVRAARRYGIDTPAPQVDFPAVMARIDEAIAAIEPHDSVERYSELGVEVLQGHAGIVDPWTVDVALPDGSSRRLTARSLVIAAGASPTVPDLPGLEALGYLTSDTLWEAMRKRAEPPARLLVLGGGPIGCELAQAFARLGSRVTLVEMADELLVKEDPEVSTAAREALVADGVEVFTGHRALRCERLGEEKNLVVSCAGEGERKLPFDELLCAVGRSPRLAGYGLEQLGIDTGRVLDTNEYLETLYPNIYAAGDVAGPYQFTHTASHMAWYATVNALFGQWYRFKVDYRVIPRATFIDPEVASVGLTEREATEKGVAFELTRYEFAELDRSITDGRRQGFIKILTPPGKDRILGVTIVGAAAAELLAEYVLAMRHGLGLNKVLGTIHSYPTLAEGNKFAAGEWKKAHAPEGLLRWVARYHDWCRR